MKIIRHGKGYKINEQKKIKCRCGCKFVATKEDIYPDKSIFGIKAYYVDCPECGRSNYYQDRF